MITKIEGTLDPTGGQGLARRNYTVMIPEIAKHFSDVKNCDRYGTINVIDLSPPLRKSFADYWTPRVTGTGRCSGAVPKSVCAAKLRALATSSATAVGSSLTIKRLTLGKRSAAVFGAASP